MINYHISFIFVSVSRRVQCSLFRMPVAFMKLWINHFTSNCYSKNKSTLLKLQNRYLYFWIHMTWSSRNNHPPFVRNIYFLKCVSVFRHACTCNEWMNGIQFHSSSSLVTYFYKMQHTITLCDYHTFELHEWYRYHTCDIFSTAMPVHRISTQEYSQYFAVSSQKRVCWLSQRVNVEQVVGWGDVGLT